MATIKIILAVLFICVIAALFVIFRRNRKNSKTQTITAAVDEKKALSKARNVKTQSDKPLHQASPANSNPGHETSDDLSQSGAISIRAEINRFIAASRWDEAIKWASHAIQALPDNDEFKVTLAEIYARANNRDRFIPIFAKLYVDLDDNKQQRAPTRHSERIRAGTCTCSSQHSRCCRRLKTACLSA